MARPREFDPMRALDDAVQVFWERGYEGAPISALVEAMGIGRASLYSTYGDKEQLFIQALGRYHVRVIAPTLEPLFDREADGLEAIEQAFESLIERLTDPERPRGCLVAVASVECASGSRRLARKLSEVLADFESGFYQALRRAQIAQQLPIEKDPRQIARALTNTAQGMAVMARIGADWRALQEIVDYQLANL